LKKSLKNYLSNNRYIINNEIYKVNIILNQNKIMKILKNLKKKHNGVKMTEIRLSTSLPEQVVIEQMIGAIMIQDEINIRINKAWQDGIIKVMINLYNDGVSLKKISKYTDFSIEDIEEIIEEEESNKRILAAQEKIRIEALEELSNEGVSIDKMSYLLDISVEEVERLLKKIPNNEKI
jgi:predicted HTH domain antitoxin